jgi:predicted SAM-dependent methyltransferase
MKQEEYVKTIVVYGKMVNVGMDDYGQQYFLEYINENGQLIEVGCGAYNYDFEDVAKTMIDYDRYSREIYGDELWEQMKKEKEERLKKYEEKEKLNGTSI